MLLNILSERFPKDPSKHVSVRGNLESATTLLLWRGETFRIINFERICQIFKGFSETFERLPQIILGVSYTTDGLLYFHIASFFTTAITGNYYIGCGEGEMSMRVFFTSTYTED